MKKVLVYVLSLFFVVAVSTIIVPCVFADYVTGKVTVGDLTSPCGNYISFSYESDLTDVLLREAIIDFTGTNVEVVSLGSICGSPQPLRATILSNQKVKVVFNTYYFYPGESATLYLELNRLDYRCCAPRGEDYEGGKVKLTFWSRSDSISNPTIAYFRQVDCGSPQQNGCAEATFNNPPIFYYWPLYLSSWRWFSSL